MRQFISKDTKNKIKIGLATGAAGVLIGGVAAHNTVDSWGKQHAIKNLKSQETSQQNTALLKTQAEVQTDNAQLVTTIEAASGGVTVQDLRVNIVGGKDTVHYTDNAGKNGAEENCDGNLVEQNKTAYFLGNCVTHSSSLPAKK